MCKPGTLGKDLNSASEPFFILSHAEAGHKCREGCHGPRLFLAEVAGEPFIPDAMLKGR